MSFEKFNLHPDLMRGIRDMQFHTPTPIQDQAIPPILEGKDLIANAQTGSGKTAAFIIPLIHRVMARPTPTRVLVVVPTRELACQIDEHALGLGFHTPVKSASVYGGVNMESQERALRAGTTIIVATPGRLLDHHRYGNWKFDSLEALVLDEADRMLDMGFLPDIQLIVSRLPKNRQTLMFSATMPDPIVKLASTIMRDPARIQIGRMIPPSSISQSFYPVAASEKEKLLAHILRGSDMKSVLVFVRTKLGADRLWHRLRRAGFSVGMIHGGREQVERDKALNDFKHGTLPILVATDVAARGIDIDDISHVVNFDIPEDPDSYIHRIGRTARAAAVGDAFTFVTPEQEELALEIEKVLGRKVERIVVPEFQREDPRAHHPDASRHHRGGPGGSRGGHGGHGGHGGGRSGRHPRGDHRARSGAH